ncbi:hypothetical protein XA68_14465 [Ophiocordyceps unilateralis]|uniref:Uncharacterized protein n=1 Tax=Ophiocordyceps unilateralis TaxID=268505 RepID=A0A2A9PA40_OPHUN|nr:hypothetical protein XA68_14465 [Ophiocordyceps unilateralis]
MCSSKNRRRKTFFKKKKTPLTAYETASERLRGGLRRLPLPQKKKKKAPFPFALSDFAISWPVKKALVIPQRHSSCNPCRRSSAAAFGPFYILITPAFAATLPSRMLKPFRYCYYNPKL